MQVFFKKKEKLLLWLIVFFGCFLRLWQLDRLELFGDELDVGYHAFSLWRTGRDYRGQFLPFYIHSFSEWRAPLLMYTTAPFVGIFGLNEWGVRLPAVLFGVANILLLYLLVKILSKDEKLALLSAFLVSCTPWHLHYSRTAFEATLLLTWILLGTVFFLQKRWLAAALSFALACYTYNTANLFVPLWILFLLWWKKEVAQENKRQLGVAFGLGLALVLPLVWITFCGPGSARFRLISIFADKNLIDQIVFKRTTGVDVAFLERLFHNKITAWGKAFGENYYSAFSPQFLFLSGDPNPRHNPPGFGEFFFWLAPFLPLGFYQLLKEKGEMKKLIGGWLILAPIPASLTIAGGTQATRLFLLLPPLVILIAFGVGSLLFPDSSASFPLGGEKLQKPVRAGFVLLLGWNLLSWWHNYFIHYPKESYQWWHYGYKEAFSWLALQEDNAGRILINNAHEPGLIRWLFWTKKDPSWFRQNFENDQMKVNLLPGFDGFKVGKAYFGIITEQDKIEWLKKHLQKDDLYLAFQGDEVPGDWDWESEPPRGIKVLKTIHNPWGEPIMYWVAKATSNANDK